MSDIQKTYTFHPSSIIDDFTLFKAEKGDVCACFNIADACYNHYMDMDDAPLDILQWAEKWYVKGMEIGSDAGYYPLGLVYMAYADTLAESQENIKQKVWYLFEAENFFLRALSEDDDTDAYYQLGNLYYEHADVLEFIIDMPGQKSVSNQDTVFITKQRQKKLQMAEKYLLMALHAGTDEAEKAHYMLGLLYFQFAYDTPKDKREDKKHWVEKSQIHTDKVLHLYPRDTAWFQCQMFLSITEFKVAFKYLKKYLFGN